VKRVRNDFSVLKLLPSVTAILLVLSSLLWFVLQYTTATNNSPAGPAIYYGAFVLLLTACTIVTWLIDDTPHQHRIPRLHILCVTAAWLTTIIGAALSTNVLTVYYLKLLEAPLIFLLLTLVAHRIWQTFTPEVSQRWFILMVLLGSVSTVLMAPSTLNVSLEILAGRALFSPGSGHVLMLVFGLALVTVSIVLIPLGRRHHQPHPTICVGPLIFTTPATPIDTNLKEIVNTIVHTYRRIALRRGQWIHYRNYSNAAHGIISTEPKSCTNALITLIEYALHKNQTRAVGVSLYDDTRHPYVHCQISYIVNTHTKTEFTTFTKHFTELGGHLHVKRTGRETILTVTFPRQW